MRRRLLDRLTYANVVATVALALSVGGGAYAAGVLPPHSIGSRELRSAAVGPSALAFGLGGQAVVDPPSQPRTLGISSCRMPNGQVSTCATHFQQLALLRFRARGPGIAFVSAAVSVHGDPDNQGSVAPVLFADLDRAGGGQQSQGHFDAADPLPTIIPYQAALPVTAGRHELRLQIWPTGDSPGQLNLDHVVLSVQVLPRLSR